MFHLFYKDGLTVITDKDFLDRLDILVEYGVIASTCNIRQTMVFKLPDGKEILVGKWLGRLRFYKTNGTLVKRREKLIQQVLVDENMLDWVSHPGSVAQMLHTDDTAWDENLKLFNIHSQNSLRFVCKGADGADVQIGRWFHNQIGKRKRSKLLKQRVKPIL